MRSQAHCLVLSPTTGAGQAKLGVWPRVQLPGQGLYRTAGSLNVRVLYLEISSTCMLAAFWLIHLSFLMLQQGCQEAEDRLALLNLRQTLGKPD